MANELLTSAAAERNKDPILTVLESVLPATGSVLEIASGSGQHVCYFAQSLPGLQWQPSEPDAAHLEAIEARVRESGVANIAAPITLDVHEPRWPVAENFDAIVCINMIHISPWASAEGLMAGAAGRLASDGKLILYGPYLEANVPTAPSNLAFDKSLRVRNPAWGLRRLDDVAALAARHDLRLAERTAMPANNLALLFART